jgi:Flp pilus assembly protein TadB
VSRDREVADSRQVGAPLVRGVIVAATSFLSFRFATRAARGDARALLRLRIVVAIVTVAVVAVLMFVPLPSWMVVEQVACGVLLAAVAVVILRPRRTSATR